MRVRNMERDKQIYRHSVSNRVAGQERDRLKDRKEKLEREMRDTERRLEREKTKGQERLEETQRRV